jgi:hypothetical protein
MISELASTFADALEASKVLGYWRAGAYHVDTNQPDGHEAGP